MMDRREALKRVGAVMGATLSLPLISGVLAGCGGGASDMTAFVPKTLSADQNELVSTLAELIIPTTDTPGARAAGVNEFIDLMITDWYGAEDRTRFLEGLAAADERARTAHKVAFVDATVEQQTAILTGFEQEALAGSSADKPFFSLLKEMTITGYYTSEIGASQELKYLHSAGYYNGDVPYAEVGRAYS
ncbi:MAG: gluconate 2-dehydrogenase subunit 3 family protein [Rhodothermales bacterium]|nr:gluconate 2-dehydrogenase subunit 3 family protein [Rhodothermales bacterium]